MCDSCAEGGRRCFDARRLRARSISSLRPQPRPDLPDINWDQVDGSPPVSLATLVDQHGAKVTGTAMATLEAAAEQEPTVTGAIQQALPAEAHLEGLEFRMKSPASLCRKIEAKAVATGQDDTSVVAAKITDVLRYTAVSTKTSDIPKTAHRVVGSLQQQGWQVVEAENSFVKDNPYMGLHLLVRRADVTVEVQFHSTESIAVKEQFHSDYEVARDPDRSPVDRVAAYRRMQQAWSGVERPDSNALERLGGLAVVAKTYPPPPGAEQCSEGRR